MTDQQQYHVTVNANGNMAGWVRRALVQHLPVTPDRIKVEPIEAGTPTDQQEYPTREQIENVLMNDPTLMKMLPDSGLRVVLDAVLALFPQPEPSGEGRVCQWCDGTARGDALDAGGDDVHNSCGSDGHGFEFVAWAPAAPPSIVDMAPGTTEDHR